MKKSIKLRKKVCITLAACLFASCPAAVMAADSQLPPDVSVVENGVSGLESQDVSVKAMSRARIVFSRQSNSVGSGSVYVSSAKAPSSLKATITLQQAAKNSSTYQNSAQTPVTKTVFNSCTLSKDFRFTISTTKKYRVKVVVKETVNGTVSTKTYYKNLQ